MEKVPERLNFSQTEESVLAFWEEINAFQQSLELSKGKPLYTFYDGPPFATGLPHYGHILAGTIKDTVTRFYSQCGFHVPRRFGWDCHGLPIEFEIEKELGIKTKEEILAYGIPNYNAQCRSIVMKFSAEWKTTVTRLGRWIDMENNYKTMDTPFMESVWSVFKTIWDKGFVYRGVKVMPFSTGCTTPLSNFEAGMNYKDVSDPELYVTFKSVEDENVQYMAWTTTPWTLPSNLALCVNPTLTYVKVEHKETKVQYIVMKERLSAIFPVKTKGKKKPTAADLPYTILEEFLGETLKGKRYVPLFDCFKDHPNAFQIILGSYVKDDSGTGVVHQAPGFGEEDYKAAVAAGVIEKGGVIPCPVDSSGRFTSEVQEFAGVYVKDADKDIAKKLKDQGRVFRAGSIVHSYPFCWRSETPLLYKAVPCWFIRVEDVKEKLLANNLKTRWVPEFVQTKRFQNWLTDAHDWAISRSRYWGTPLPVWASEDMQEIIAIGSIEELQQLSGVENITDLHRENIDHITIPSKEGRGDLRRIEDVFDCWFESGSMPYAQAHYPFENKDNFEKGFPADFVAEGIDQTRGWFYTLLVISTLLFDQPPFKNLIANGLVLAEDGKKMSKRLKNYPDPNLIINEYGADALRMYLINSPVVRGETLCFKQQGVHGIIRDMLLPWFNAYRFLVQNVHEYEAANNCKFTPDLSLALQSENVMDKWILASLQSLIAFSRTELEAYRLYTVLPKLVEFIEQLTNWYVRLNRKRLRGNLSSKNAAASQLAALNTLFEVLLTTSKTLAPFTPFFTEYVYQNLRKCLPENTEQSVHFTEYPKPNETAVNKDIEESVSIMQSIIELARCARERRKMAHRQPLAEILVFLQNPEDEQKLKSVESYLYDELNVLKIVFPQESSLLTYQPIPNFKVLGKRLGKDVKTVAAAVKKMTTEQLKEFMNTGKVNICGHELFGEDIQVNKLFTGEADIYEPSNASQGNLTVAVNVSLTPELIQEGMVRHLINRIQRFRKEVGIVVSDEIEVFFHATSEDAKNAVAARRSFIQKRLGKRFTPAEFKSKNTPLIGSTTYSCNGTEAQGVFGENVDIVIEISPKACHLDSAAILKNTGKDETFVNELQDLVFSKKELLQELTNGPATLSLNGTDVVLTLGENVFFYAGDLETKN